VKGEAAAALWLDGAGFRLNEASGEFGMADLVAGRPGPPWVRIEVKSWPVGQWGRFGLQVAACQVEKVLSDAWLIVWARVDGDVVTLHGWTHVADVVLLGLPVWSAGVHANVQVPKVAVRPMGELVVLDPARFAFGSPVRPGAVCGHERVRGLCWGCAEVPAGLVLPDVVEVAGRKFHAVDAGPHGGWVPGVGERVPLSSAVVSSPACLTCFPTVW
jgi:hypothetical protein